LAKGSLSAGDLANELRIHGASLSRIIKALDKKGYIYRDPTARDSRRKVLALTETGRALADTLAGCEARLFPVVVEERRPGKTLPTT
jgi:DNA-binding MarR family transcriptional regulator